MGRRNAAALLRGRSAMRTSLSLAAGCVDAVGYLGLGLGACGIVGVTMSLPWSYYHSTPAAIPLYCGTTGHLLSTPSPSTTASFSCSFAALLSW
jgi:hypothetical protein